ncbi:TPM domain-containing protein [Phenylobacterium aquaticum]|uniref:TPM domain-containing protein n=1 Tax=Phenylobacterium aquaticum TaxID=1763816 RepID=UPI001F5CED2A|nr:TPM domain-containing protein [Phenylobacterium aquaticum]MCI3132187.1 TPM domain-containing protein [Phenylobacterium aquaticum]
MDVGIRRRLSLAFSLVAGLLLLAGPAGAAPKYPALTGRVIDAAGVLPASVENTLAAQSEALEARTTDQFVIVTVPSLQGYSIEDYSQGLGNSWRLGQIGKNNGVLLVVAPKERKVRIEPGFGLEKVLDNETSAAIVQGVILPQFRKGALAKGVSAGAEAIIDRLNASPPVGTPVGTSVAASPQALAAPAATPEPVKPASLKSSGGDATSSIVALAVICFILFLMYKIVTGIFRFLGGLAGMAFRPKGGGFAPPPAGFAPYPPGGFPPGAPNGYPPGYPPQGYPQGYYPQAGYGYSPFINRATTFGAGAVAGALADRFFNRPRGVFGGGTSSSLSDVGSASSVSSSGSISAGGGSFSGGGSSSGGSSISGGGGSFGGGGGASGSW